MPDTSPDERPPRRAPAGALWVIAGVIILTIAGITATIAISLMNDVPGGYIPREARGVDDPGPDGE